MARRSIESEGRRRSIERHGLGQSGYTAGRHEDDPALERELEPDNLTYPHGEDEDDEVRRELGTDDRFTGRGGRQSSQHSER